MAISTVYVFQPFVKAKKGGRIIRGQARSVPTERAARRALDNIGSTVVGGVVFATEADLAAGEWGETVILAQGGDVPADFLEAFGA